MFVYSQSDLDGFDSGDLGEMKRGLLLGGLEMKRGRERLLRRR